MILRIVLPALLFILLAERTVAQIRQTNPSVNTKVVPVVRQPVKDTVPKRENRPVKIQDNNIGASKISGIKTPKTSSVTSNNQFISPNLKRVVQYIGSDPDVKPPVWVTEYHVDEMKYITGKSETPQWQSDFIWYHIPESAAY
jgi:cytoskeletal protein RodZ